MINKTPLLLCVIFLTLQALDGKRLESLRVGVRPSHPRIIGGEEVKPHSLPFQVGLTINGNAFCGGALISPNYVITAGHCGVVIRSVVATFGAHNISNPSEPSQVQIAGEKVIVHEQFDENSLKNDIALIQLASSVALNQNIQVIKVADDANDTYTGQIATASGWGLPHDVPFPTTSDMSDVLLAVDVQVSDLETCKATFNDDDVDLVTDTSVCTSGYRNKGTCNGDSGGPLTLDGALVGLTSFGTDECELCAPSVYTKVAAFAEWIAANSDVKF